MISPPWYPVPPPGYGGTESMIDVLARGLAERGHHVTLFATGDSTCSVGRRYTLDTALGIEAQNDRSSELLHLEAAYRELADCDVVHDHTLLGPAVQLRELPVVTTVHGPIDQRTRRLLAAFPRNVSAVAISQSQRDLAPPAVFTAVIHHGIEYEQWPPGSGAGGYLLFLGRMSPDKGVDAAISAARQAGMPLRIAAKMSSDEERDYFVEAIEPRLGGGVEFVGEVGGGERLDLIRGATALLNPLRWMEPFGLVMIESLAVGTPVISTRWGSSPEIVEPGRTGFLCGSLAETVAACRAVSDLDRAACRDSVVRRFSAARMVGDYQRLYEAVVGWPQYEEQSAVDLRSASFVGPEG